MNHCLLFSIQKQKKAKKKQKKNNVIVFVVLFLLSYYIYYSLQRGAGVVRCQPAHQTSQKRVKSCTFLSLRVAIYV